MITLTREGFGMSFGYKLAGDGVVGTACALLK